MGQSIVTAEEDKWSLGAGGEARGTVCFMGTEFPSGVVKMFWISVEVLFVQHLDDVKSH